MDRLLTSLGLVNTADQMMLFMYTRCRMSLSVLSQMEPMLAKVQSNITSFTQYGVTWSRAQSDLKRHTNDFSYIPDPLK